MKPKLPKSWKDITLEQYADIYDITQQKPDTSNPFWELDQHCQLLSVVTGDPYDKLIDLQTAEIKKRFRAISFLSTPPAEKQIRSFRTGGYRWHVNYDITRGTASQYIDISELSKETHNLIHNAPQIMAVYCEPTRFNPIKLKWEPVEMSHSDKVELLKRCPVSVAYPLTVFFCKVWKNLISNTGGYLSQMLSTIQKELQQEAATSMTAAGGSSHSTIYQTTTELSGTTI